MELPNSVSNFLGYIRFDGGHNFYRSDKWILKI